MTTTPSPAPGWYPDPGGAPGVFGGIAHVTMPDNLRMPRTPTTPTPTPRPVPSRTVSVKSAARAPHAPVPGIRAAELRSSTRGSGLK